MNANEEKLSRSRYKNGKVEDTITLEDFQDFLIEAKNYREWRREMYGDDWRFKDINVCALFSVLYYTGLRVAEVVGDIKRKYETKRYGTRRSSGHTGILKEHVTIEENHIRIRSDKPLKHGKREAPLYVPKDKPGVDEIIEVWEKTERGERLFPISKTYAWRFVTDVTQRAHDKNDELVRVYPHFFRLNRVSRWCEHKDTTIKELKDWFGWRDPETIASYLAKGGKSTKRMADRDHW